jgi:hypothetical protein
VLVAITLDVERSLALGAASLRLPEGDKALAIEVSRATALLTWPLFVISRADLAAKLVDYRSRFTARRGGRLLAFWGCHGSSGFALADAIANPVFDLGADERYALVTKRNRLRKLSGGAPAIDRGAA